MTNLVFKEVTVASGASLSSAIDTEGKEVLILRAPATLTGTTLTVKHSDSLTGTFNDRQINGDEISLAIAGGDEIQFNPPLVGFVFKFDTGSNEAAARTLTVGLRQVM